MLTSAGRHGTHSDRVALLFCFGIGLALAGIAPASAQITTYAAATAGSQSKTLSGPINTPSDTGFVALNDGLGNLGQAETNIKIGDGSLAAASHGCAEPKPGFFNGNGNGHTASSFNDIYDLTSTTLAAGTPVDVEVHLSAKLMKTFTYQLKSLNDNIVGEALLRFGFRDGMGNSYGVHEGRFGSKLFMGILTP